MPLGAATATRMNKTTACPARRRCMVGPGRCRTKKMPKAEPESSSPHKKQAASEEGSWSPGGPRSRRHQGPNQGCWEQIQKAGVEVINIL